MSTTYIALLRGINVGGSHVLPMKELVRLLEGLGCREVRTYIQSGNAVFSAAAGRAEDWSGKITAAIRRSHGFAPDVRLLTLAELGQAAADNPFPLAEAAPKSLHLCFLSAVPTTPDWPAIEALRKDSERLVLKGRVLYFLTPDGFGTSRLADRMERLLGTAGTARNWRSITKILELARAAGPPAQR